MALTGNSRTSRRRRRRRCSLITSAAFSLLLFSILLASFSTPVLATVHDGSERMQTVSIATSTTLPSCVQDGRVLIYNSDEMVEGSITDGARRCPAGKARTLSILQQPALPSLLFPSGEWNYRLAVKTLEEDEEGDETEVVTTFAVLNLCDGEPICKATVTLRIQRPATTTTITTTSTAAPQSNHTDTNKGEGETPRCYDDRTNLMTHTYQPGRTSLGSFPLDHTVVPVSCRATTTVLQGQPSYGMMAAMPSSLQYPYSYLYTAPERSSEDEQQQQQENSLPVKMSNVTYRIYCSPEVLLCEANLQIKVSNAPPDCQHHAIRTVSPYTPVEGKVEMGSFCQPGEEERLRVVSLRTVSGVVWDALLQLTGMYYSFEGYKEEDYVVVVDYQCRNTSTRRVQHSCRSSLVFIVSSGAEQSNSTTSSTAAPQEEEKKKREDRTTLTTTTAAPHGLPAPLQTLSYEVPIGTSLFSTIILQEDIAATLCPSNREGKGLYLRYAVIPHSESSWIPTPPGEAPSSSSSSSSSSPTSFEFTVNLLGQFEVKVPATTSTEFIETEEVGVWCGENFLGAVRLLFTVYRPLIEEQSPPSSRNNNNSSSSSHNDDEDNTAIVPPECPNVFYYTTPTGVDLHSSLLGMGGSSSNGEAGSCPEGRTPYFQLLSPLPAIGVVTLQPTGEFVYRPPPAPQEVITEFYFAQFCGPQVVQCRGKGYLIVYDVGFDNDDRSTSPPDQRNDESTAEGDWAGAPLRLTCTGTCVEEAWKTYPTQHMWGKTANILPSGSTAEGVTVQWREDALIITSDTLIGVMGVRFPSFKAIDFTHPTNTTTEEEEAAEPSSNRNDEAAGDGQEGEDEDEEWYAWEKNQLIPFNQTCVTSKGAAGKGDDVWVWNSMNPDRPSASHGHLGELYNRGHSWYQLFGGKHLECDIFQTPKSVCSYAPLFTVQPPWSLSIHGCRARWTAVLPYKTLLKLRTSQRPTTSLSQIAPPSPQTQPVFTFHDGHQISGTVVTQGVQPRMWSSAAGGVDQDIRSYHIQMKLTSYVEILPTTFESRPFSVDARLFGFTFSEKDKEVAPAGEPGDLAFGINLLLYPRVPDAGMNQHVVGFKWLQQMWSSPGADACSTCVGTKLRCYGDTDISTSTYQDDAFPFGECPPEVGRVQLWKGPPTTLADLERACVGRTAYPQMGFVTNRRGFSTVADCRSAQNLTLRGVLPGSGSLSLQQKQQIHLEGTITIQVLMVDGLRHNIRVKVTFYVSYLSKQLLRLPAASAVSSGGPAASTVVGVQPPVGTLHTCLASPYSPVLDPLGYSTPYRPLAILSPHPGGDLCVDTGVTSFGPTDWALFVLEMTGKEEGASSLKIGNIYVTYHIIEHTSRHTNLPIYLRYIDPDTGLPGVPPAEEGDWWQDTYPSLAFRNLNSDNGTLAGTMSAAVGEVMGIQRSPFSFLFIPGSLGLRSQVEVVVNAVYDGGSTSSSDSHTSSSFARQPVSMEFRHFIHTSPGLTEFSRYGQLTYTSSFDAQVNHKEQEEASSSVASERRRLSAEVMVVVISGILLLAVVIVIAADKKKPLPHWMPRGDTLSFLWRRSDHHPSSSSSSSSSNHHHHLRSRRGDGGVEEEKAASPAVLSTAAAAKPSKLKGSKDMYEAMRSGQYD